MDIAEKRVYEDSAGRTRLAVATDAGLAIVGVSGDVIGEFGLALREPARDVVALGDGRLLVASGDDALLVELADGAGIAATESVVETGAGATAAVAALADVAVAASEEGAIRTVAIPDLDASNGSWTELGDVEGTVRAADGRYLATADGCYRVADDRDGVDRVELEDCRDVAAAGPFAATGEGCYAGVRAAEDARSEASEWTRELADPVDVVAASPRDGRAHAASEEILYQRAAADGTESAADGAESAAEPAWTEAEWPASAPVADLAYADATLAVAADGTVLADAGDGWRTRSIGLPDVEACAVVR